MMREAFIRVLGRAEGRPAAQVEADIRDELGLHVAYLEKELRETGASVERARAGAAERFGNPEAFGRECRSIALKEHVMIQRVNFVLLIVVAAGLGLALVDASQTQRANRRAMEAFTTRLEALTPPGAFAPQAPTTRPASHLGDLPWIALSWDEPPRELAGPARPRVPALDTLRCFDTPVGWIFCSTEKTARLLAEDVKEAALTFKKYFGAEPPRGAVYVIDEAGAGDVMKELRDAGAKWTMPWFSGEDPLAGADKPALRKQVEEQVRKQMEEQGINDDAMVKQQVEAALAKLGAGEDAYRPLRHELGHVWFIREFWGEKALGAPFDDQADADKKGDDVFGADEVMHYGGPATDWLDEIAAILMEDEELTRSRRDHFASIMEQNPGAAIPLRELFTMKHPVGAGEGLGADPEVKEAIEKAKRQALEKMLKDGSTTSSTVVTIPLVREVDMLGDAGKAVMFYEQLRSVADFILARSKTPMVFRNISRAEAEGKTIEKWLETDGAAAGLPSTIEKFESEWRAWTREKGKK